MLRDVFTTPDELGVYRTYPDGDLATLEEIVAYRCRRA